MSGPDEGPKGKVVFILVVHIPLEARLIFWRYLCSGSLNVRHQNIYKLVSNLDTGPGPPPTRSSWISGLPMLSSAPALFCYHCNRYEFIRKAHDLEVWVTLWRGQHWPTRWSWSAPRTETRESIDLSRVHYTQEISLSCSQPLSPSGNTVSLDSKCLTEDGLTSVTKEVPYCQSGKKDNANCMKSMLAGSASKNNPLTSLWPQ